MQSTLVGRGRGVRERGDNAGRTGLEERKRSQARGQARSLPTRENKTKGIADSTD